MGVVAVGALATVLTIGLGASDKEMPEGAVASAGVEHVPAPTAMPPVADPPVVVPVSAATVAEAAPTVASAVTAQPEVSAIAGDGPAVILMR